MNSTLNQTTCYLQPATDSPKVSGEVLADQAGHFQHIDALAKSSVHYSTLLQGNHFFNPTSCRIVRCFIPWLLTLIASLNQQLMRSEGASGLATGKTNFNFASGLMMRPSLSLFFLMYSQTSGASHELALSSLSAYTERTLFPLLR